jgi:phosphotransferase system IIB component
MSSKAEQILAGLGGADNVVEIEACITRLRTEVRTARWSTRPPSRPPAPTA